MAQSTPLVEHNVLTLQNEAQTIRITLGSPEWWSWLESAQITTFYFKAPQGSFTARREKKSGSFYWYAYRKYQGRLAKAYLGKSAELHLTRLEEIALQLAQTLTTRQINNAQTSQEATSTHEQAIELEPFASLYGPLLRTKFSPPPTRTELVVRSRLRERLDRGARQKLLLLSAPAGFGKTTLLSAWQSTLDGPSAWLSLDKNDNDVTRFWLYVITALQQSAPNLNDQLSPLLYGPSHLPTETRLSLLLNVLAAYPDRLILLLDDYHLITTQEIHDSLSFLLEHLPAHVHLVIAGRTDPPLPLTRLRAQGQLYELRADDLRFSLAEVTDFLREVMHLNLSATEIQTLDTHTEGWVVGLQLAALSMQERGRFNEVIAQFTGSHRYILDYLTDEVLQRQPEHVRDFLLHTSLLERLSASLCNTVMEQDDGQSMLEYLERMNLFLIPLDEQREWYRYHHLFAEFLQTRLRQQHARLLPELHRRASGWYAQHGLLLEAVMHALQAQDAVYAADLVEDAARELMKRGEVVTLLSCLHALPEELVYERPLLLLAQGSTLAAIGQLDVAEQCLDKVEQLLQQKKSTMDLSTYAQLEAETAAVYAVLFAFREDLDQSIIWAQKALALAVPDAVFVRGIAASSLGSAYLLRGDLQNAQAAFAEAVSSGRASHNLHAVLASIAALGYIQVAQGQLQQAVETHKQGILLSQSEGEHILPVVSLSYASLSEIWYEWNDLTKAEQYARKGIELGKRWGYVGVLAQACCSLATIQLVQGNVSEAFSALEQLKPLIQGHNMTSVSGLVDGYTALVNLHAGKLEQAEQWVRQAGLSEHDTITFPNERKYLAVTQILIAQKQYATARCFLETLQEQCESDRRTTYLIASLVQRAQLEQLVGETPLALKLLSQAVQLAAPEGFLRSFLDKGEPLAGLLRLLLHQQGAPAYTHTLLHAFGEHPTLTDSSNQVGEGPLSERELHILNCIAAGKANRTIAQELFIELSTVKTHLSNIYSKLGVHSRTQALLRARELQLLP